MNEIIRIKDSEVDQLTPVLFYCMELVGFNPKNLETYQLKIITDFIKGNYPHLKLNEIKEAFDCGVKGLLTAEMKHFQSFDSMYVVSIIKAYKEYLQKENAKPKLAAPIEKQLQMTKESKEDFQRNNFETINDWFKEHGEVPMFANWNEAFLHMERVDLIKVSHDEKQMFLDNMLYDLKQEIRQLRISGSNYGHLSKILEKKGLLKMEARKRFIIKYYENK